MEAYELRAILECYAAEKGGYTFKGNSQGHPNAWQPAIEKAVAESETCAVFIGPSGLGPWQNEEMRAAIDRRVRESDRRFRVIPVLPPGAERAERSSLPTFLAATTWVEFRDSLDDSDAFHRSRWPLAILRPGSDPVESLAVAISRALNVAQSAPALAELIEGFQKNEKTLHFVSRQSLPETSGPVVLAESSASRNTS